MNTPPSHLDRVAGPDVPTVVRSYQAGRIQGKERDADRYCIRSTLFAGIDTSDDTEADQQRNPYKGKESHHSPPHSLLH